MAKSHWYDPQGGERIRAEEQGGGGLPGFTAAPYPDQPYRMRVTGDHGGLFQIDQSSNPAAYDFTEGYLGDPASPSYIDIYTEHDRPDGTYDEATVDLVAAKAFASLSAVGDSTNGYLARVVAGAISAYSWYAGDGALQRSALTVTGQTGQSVPGVAVADADIEVESAANGVVLRSPNGTRYRITVADDGALSTTFVSTTSA